MHSRLVGIAGRWLKSFGAELARARRGNIALIFALTAIPVLITGGAGIDLARALAVRAKLYSAVDAAALAVASKSGITQGAAQTLAQQYFNANYELNTSFGAPDGVNVVLGAQSVTVTVQSNMPTTLMGVAGFQHVNLDASSNVVWGQTRIWVGLALDNTGSMCEPSSSPCPNPASNTKIYALKSATHSLLTMFQNAAATPGDVQVSMVPFVKDVNVGASNYAATWIDWTDWDAANGSCSISGKTSQSSCTSAGTCTGYGSGGAPNSQSSCQSAGTCSISGNTSQSSCQNATVGSCSISGYTTQSTCQNAGTCTISGNNSQSSCTNAFVYKCSDPQYTTQSSCTTHVSGGTCSISQYTTSSSCTANYTLSCTNAAQTTQSSCTGQKACSKSQYTTQSSCTNHSGTWGFGTWTVKTYGVWTNTYNTWNKVYGVWTSTPGVWTLTHGVWTPATWAPGTWTPSNHSTWTGCVEDRGDTNAPSNPAYDTVNTAPGNSAASKFPAEQYSACPQALTALGYNWTTLNSKVDAMVAQGGTNQPIGLAWAWQSLTQGAPLSPPSLPANTARHIIILSDGENTQDRWYGTGSSHSQSVDDRMSLLCQNARADGITIWTVFVNIAGTAGNAGSMQDCATGGQYGGHYMEVTSTSGIGAAFNIIGQQITNLRVAH